jgi:hypothetical protein
MLELNRTATDAHSAYCLGRIIPSQISEKVLKRKRVFPNATNPVKNQSEAIPVTGRGGL